MISDACLALRLTVSPPHTLDAVSTQGGHQQSNVLHSINYKQNSTVISNQSKSTISKYDKRSQKQCSNTRQCNGSSVAVVKSTPRLGLMLAAVRPKHFDGLSRKILPSEAPVSVSNLSNSTQSQMRQSQGIRRPGQEKIPSTNELCSDPTRSGSLCKPCTAAHAIVWSTMLVSVCRTMPESKFASNGRTWQAHNIENVKNCPQYAGSQSARISCWLRW